jgi:hypothetical protein
MSKRESRVCVLSFCCLFWCPAGVYVGVLSLLVGYTYIHTCIYIYTYICIMYIYIMLCLCWCASTSPFVVGSFVT